MRTVLSLDVDYLGTPKVTLRDSLPQIVQELGRWLHTCH